jgi:pyruvate/2-oxoglutarate dehydrogenase complex dihydrolipoamide dehydrogenase (E3) component
VTDVETKGLVKIIIDKKGLILGAHIVGTHADEIMQGLLVAKSQKIPLVKIAQTMFIYPTLSELIKKTAAKPLVEVLGKNPFLKKMLNLLKSF